MKQWKVVQYCWWKKSCTSWDVVYPIIYRVLHIPGGYIPGGDRRISEPSTVPPHQVTKNQDNFEPKTSAIENIWDASHSLMGGITPRGIPNISLQVVTVFWEGFRMPMFIIYININIYIYVVYIQIIYINIICIYIYQQLYKSPRGVIIRPSNLDQVCYLFPGCSWNDTNDVIEVFYVNNMAGLGYKSHELDTSPLEV